MRSIWSETTILPAFPSLSGGLSTDAAVIGGGMAGILIAWELNQRGIKTVVLEANRVGSGQTQNTTAKITVSHNLIYQKLISDLGMEKAQKYADANQQALRKYETMIHENKIDCHFMGTPSCLYSVADEGIIEQETDAARKLGLDVSFTKKSSLPFLIKGAIKYHNQAQFHPLEFLSAIAKPLTIFEHVEVKHVEENKIVTNSGTITANHIVFATHFPFMNRPGYYFMRMHQERSYALALEHAGKMDGMYLGVDPKSSYSFRNYGDLLLLGGASHRTGENTEGVRVQNLRKQAGDWWPKSRQAAFWSAQDCMTPDGIPYIGRYSSTKANWYVATGFGKWGMTTSMAAAGIISDGIMGWENSYCDLFSPQRPLTLASSKKIMADGMKSAKGLIRQNLKLPKATTDELSEGHGGIVTYEGKKVGAYKDAEGNLFLVTTKCPHLGCQLEWNQESLSWECPCHGSRFDYKGNLLDNPAQNPIKMSRSGLE